MGTTARAELLGCRRRQEIDLTDTKAEKTATKTLKDDDIITAHRRVGRSGASGTDVDTAAHTDADTVTDSDKGKH